MVGAMGVFAWIAMGLIAGLLARRVVRDDRSGCIYTIIVGVLGALIGGALAQAAGAGGLGDDLTLRSVIVAFLGAVLLLLALQAISGRSRRRRKRR